jgi:hypothetical protein
MKQQEALVSKQEGLQPSTLKPHTLHRGCDRHLTIFGSSGGRDPLIRESRPRYKGVATSLDFKSEPGSISLMKRQEEGL